MFYVCGSILFGVLLFVMKKLTRVNPCTSVSKLAGSSVSFIAGFVSTLSFTTIFFRVEVLAGFLIFAIADSEVWTDFYG